MNTNRKVRPQPSLASLTADEYRQLADMVCTRTYEDVRQQVNKPRSEGGFDLHISVKPLQVLHARVRRLEKINAQLAIGEKLTLTAYDEIHSGEHRAPEEVHDAIMSATYVLVTEQDNTPHQLLALQRLADFPARAELREQSAALRAQSAEDLSRLREQSAQIRAERLEITRAREERAKAKADREKAKAQREAEMHTHKIQMDHIRVFLKSNNRGGTSFSGGTSSQSPTSISRGAITNNDAAPATQTSPDLQFFSAPKSETENQKSEIRSPLSTLNSQLS